MVSPPELHSEIYDAVDPKHFKDSQKGKVVLVIGSARNIGQGIAIQFAKAGANIAAFDLRDLNETLALVEKEGVIAKGWELDASDEKSVRDAIDQVEETLGPIDILVNVAGITGSRPIFMEHFDNFWKTMRINTGCAIISMLKVLPLMKARKRGVIINVASRAGTIDYVGSFAYAVSKTALVRAVGCIQKELDAEGLGDEIQVYALHPGAVLTDMPKGAIPPDVAEVYPERVKARNEILPKMIVSRFLCGATCVYIASGKAKVLKGRYFDCEQDIGYVVSHPEEIVEEDLYRLGVRFLGGLPNDGGIVKYG